MHQNNLVLLSLKQASAELKYTKKGLEQRLNTSSGVIDFGSGLRLQTIKLGGQRLIHRAVLQQFLDQLAGTANTNTPTAAARRVGRPTKVEAARRRLAGQTGSAL